jgi:hypothetical protein
MSHYSPQLVERWTCVSSPLLSHTPTGEEQVVQVEPYCRVQFDLGGVSQLAFWRQGWILDHAIFIFYFVRLPLCNKYSDYCDIYLYTLCDYICCLLWCMYEMHPALFLKARGVTEVVSEETLTVRRNLDRNGHNHSLLILLWFFLYLSHLDLVTPSTVLLWLTLPLLL